MTAEAPTLAPRGRYAAGEAAKLLGIHRNTLLKYTNTGLIKKRTTQMGRGYYLGSDLMKLWKLV